MIISGQPNNHQQPNSHHFRVTEMHVAGHRRCKWRQSLNAYGAAVGSSPGRCYDTQTFKGYMMITIVIIII